ncbi:Lecithine-cholesterol acyltransferase-like 4 [Hordeum vulgare]|nr:Lecithine-cholesterol acyltransferase-like 4 [Hordeum vulgare]
MSTDSDTSLHDDSNSFRKITSYRECLPLAPLCLFWLWRNDVSTVSVAVLEDLVWAIELWLRIATSRCRWWTPASTRYCSCLASASATLSSRPWTRPEQGAGVGAHPRADHECREKLWAQFDASTGKIVCVDEKIRIIVPEDRYGLYAIDTLDPDLIIGDGSVYYYHDMIVQMIKWGYQEGKTLFGFGYDFRQSNR